MKTEISKLTRYIPRIEADSSEEASQLLVEELHAYQSQSQFTKLVKQIHQKSLQNNNKTIMINRLPVLESIIELLFGILNMAHNCSNLQDFKGIVMN